MKKNVLRIGFIILLTSVFFSSFSVSAANDIKMQMFFAPGIMNEQTGEINVELNMKNYNIVVYDALGQICSVTFSFDYSLEGFDIKRDNNGTPLFTFDETTLIKSSEDVLISEPIPGRVSLMFLDETLKERLINHDGTLCRFTLLSKSPLSFWNSITTYPIRFVPGSIGLVMYNNESQNVNRLYDVEGIDNSIGAYNRYPTLVSPKLGKTISFSVGDASVTVDGQKTVTDAAPFLQGSEVMVPVRFLTENLNMEVFWDGTTRSVAAFTQFKSLTLSVSDSSVYVNSAYYYFSPGPMQVGDRVYVPISLMSKLYPESTVTVVDNVVTIAVP